jgi:hypothetical protein
LVQATRRARHGRAHHPSELGNVSNGLLTDGF